jgi:hypothetical protein
MSFKFCFHYVQYEIRRKETLMLKFLEPPKFIPIQIKLFPPCAEFLILLGLLTNYVSLSFKYIGAFRFIIITIICTLQLFKL